MYDNDEIEPHESRESALEENNTQALTRAGITGTIRVHQPTLLQAHKALLEKTFISSNDEAYFWIKTQYPALKEWHRLHTGWSIERRNDLFCLLRQPSALTLGYVDSKCELQKARDFVYVSWILWYAANDQIAKRGNGQVFLLLQMLERLTEEWRFAGCINELTLGESADFANQPPVMSNRRSMAQALKYLQGLQCLKELDGQVDSWVEQDVPVLYQFTNAIHLLTMSLDPDTRDAVIAHQKEATIFTPTVFTLRKEKHSALIRAWRVLLIGPFLLRGDDPEAFSALLEHVDKVQDDLDAAFGWSLEVNHDYACVIRDTPSTVAPNLFGSKTGSDQILLLFCGELRNQVAANMLKPDYDGCITTTVPYLLDILAAMRNRFEEHWGQGMRNKNNKVMLTEILTKMRRIGFIRGPDSKNTVFILPTAARYSPRYTEPSDDTPSLENERKEQVNFQQTNLWSEEEMNDN